MSTKSFVFSAAAPVGENTQLEQDGNGYYYCNLGEIDAYNEAGNFYLAKGVEDLIKNESGAFYRKLTRGYLKGETNHPKYVAGMSKHQWIMRNLDIDKDRVSHSIRQIDLIPTGIKTIGPDGIPRETIKIKGWIKPIDDRLKKDLDDPNANVAFSVRCLTEDVEIKPGIFIKTIVELITFDWVEEPGIRTANKFATVSGESLNSISISLEDISSLTVNIVKSTSGVSTESSESIIDTLKSINKKMEHSKKDSRLSMFKKW